MNGHRIVGLSLVATLAGVAAAPQPVRADPLLAIVVDAPLSFDGPIGLRMEVVPSQSALCTLGSSTMGVYEGLGVLAYVGFGRGWGTMSVPQGAQAHGPSVDTRFRAGPEAGWWASHTTLSVRSDQPIVLDVVVAHARAVSTVFDPHTVHLEVSCDQPFLTRNLAASREAKTFDTTSLDGVGASNGRTTTVNLLDSANGSFSSPTVHVGWRGFENNGASAGVLGVEHSSGPTAIPLVGTGLTPLRELDNKDLSDGAGNYRVSLTRAGAGGLDGGHGFVFGARPVGCLDEIL